MACMRSGSWLGKDVPHELEAWGELVMAWGGGHVGLIESLEWGGFNLELG
ncbi:MAG: hypothetical protein RI897_4111 [Verrucomicrobiota bacterium]